MIRRLAVVLLLLWGTLPTAARRVNTIQNGWRYAYWKVLDCGHSEAYAITIADAITNACIQTGTQGHIYEITLQCKWESWYRQSEVSSHGAIGIIQVVPRWYTNFLYYAYGSSDPLLLYEPEKNIMVGVMGMTNYARIHGGWDWAVIAYTYRHGARKIRECKRKGLPATRYEQVRKVSGMYE